MEIRPGDVAMLPVVMGMTVQEIDELRDHLWRDRIDAMREQLPVRPKR